MFLQNVQHFVISAYSQIKFMRMSESICKKLQVYNDNHSFISQTISIAPFQTARILCRSFTPKRQRQLWVKDLSKVPTWAGFEPMTLSDERHRLYQCVTTSHDSLINPFKTQAVPFSRMEFKLWPTMYMEIIATFQTPTIHLVILMKV